MVPNLKHSTLFQQKSRKQFPAEAQLDVFQLNVYVDNTFFDVNNMDKGWKPFYICRLRFYYLNTLNYVPDNKCKIDEKKMNTVF